MTTPRSRSRRKALDEWISTAARLIGLVGLVAFGVVWVTADRVEPLLVAAAGGLYGLGKGGEALATLRNSSSPGHAGD